MGKKRFWYLIGIGVLIIVLMIFVSEVITVGEKLREVHLYLEYGFYILSALVIYFLVLNPLRIILFAKTFSLDASLNENERYHIYKSVAKNLLKSESLKEEDKANLKANLNNKDELKHSLKEVFNTSIKDEINDLIRINSKNVLISTAISQNGNLDMLSVLIVNLKMIKEIVMLTGYRPSYMNLGKLALNVLSTSLVADGLEDIDMNEVLPSKLTETLTDIPFVKTMSHSILNGTSNALLTLRVGIITRTYLYRDADLHSKKELRRIAFKESVTLMPGILKDGLSFFPKTIVNLFTKPFKKQKQDN
ncbi:hypothetical protein CI105_08640 [Candidatus Izimaplasma bacterium ZiA1]|uniref:DUF697 domain-containing protein n=1 Tax=Candidatus Izimoplasma sp. ZiA1 TaxID=2024899 RepID=UPI000BAA3C76|nr:hypothetical protein CI105_08640 [Candidatus Izimaplasma bacterium ZiA1]